MSGDICGGHIFKIMWYKYVGTDILFGVDVFYSFHNSNKHSRKFIESLLFQGMGGVLFANICYQKSHLKNMF